jgi:hypothetical protein
MTGARFEGGFWRFCASGIHQLILDNRVTGISIETSPPIPVRVEWADSQGRVTASWLAAHFNFFREVFG